MDSGDRYVLDLTQRWHDQIDAALGRELQKRALMGMRINEEMRAGLDPARLTADQAAERAVVRRRIAVELLGMPEWREGGL